MSEAPTKIHSSTRRLDPVKVELLLSLKPGQKIKVVQTVRVGSRRWTSEAEGEFRGLNYLATGLSTDRIPDDDVIVPMLHFTKPNGELSSIAIDENTRVEVI